MIYFMNNAKIISLIWCYRYSVELQKRGLPHVHLLVWLKEKITPDRVDSIITHQSRNTKSKRGSKVIHNYQVINGAWSCSVLNMNSPFMKDGKCTKKKYTTKKYPRKFIVDTLNSKWCRYPLYRGESLSWILGFA